MRDRIWILLSLNATDTDTPGWGDAYSSRTTALQALYGFQRGANAARLQWVRRRDGFYEARDPKDPDTQVMLFEEDVDEAVDADWRGYGFTGDLPDLDAAPPDWLEESADA